MVGGGAKGREAGIRMMAPGASEPPSLGLLCEQRGEHIPPVDLDVSIAKATRDRGSLRSNPTPHRHLKQHGHRLQPIFLQHVVLTLDRW